MGVQDHCLLAKRHDEKPARSGERSGDVCVRAAILLEDALAAKDVEIARLEEQVADLMQRLVRANLALAHCRAYEDARAPRGQRAGLEVATPFEGGRGLSAERPRSPQLVVAWPPDRETTKNDENSRSDVGTHPETSRRGHFHLSATSRSFDNDDETTSSAPLKNMAERRPSSDVISELTDDHFSISDWTEDFFQARFPCGRAEGAAFCQSFPPLRRAAANDAPLRASAPTRCLGQSFPHARRATATMDDAHLLLSPSASLHGGAEDALRCQEFPPTGGAPLPLDEAPLHASAPRRLHDGGATRLPSRPRTRGATACPDVAPTCPLSAAEGAAHPRSFPRTRQAPGRTDDVPLHASAPARTLATALSGFFEGRRALSDTFHSMGWSRVSLRHLGARGDESLAGGALHAEDEIWSYQSSVKV